MTKVLKKFLVCTVLSLILFALAPAFAHAQGPSPEIHPDKSVTFRVSAPDAKEVSLSIEGTGKPIEMAKSNQGIWSVTLPPMQPDFYSYSFSVDGFSGMDRSNPLAKPSVFGLTSMLHVPGPPSLPWEVNDVPHGQIHHHFYRSGILSKESDFFVYTPPGYDPAGKPLYPVLYLLHGFSDDASAWTIVGRANVVLDNLIASGKAKPMLIVMPLGYGEPSILSHDFDAPEVANLRLANSAKFGDILLCEIIPQIETSYRVSRDPKSRAIAGLSMGGAQSLLIGLNHTDTFHWIGAFSSGVYEENFDAEFPKVDSSTNQQVKLLWVACGTDDSLIVLNRKFREWLKSKSADHVDVETPGGHGWTVWRRNLPNFLPLLFR